MMIPSNAPRTFKPYELSTNDWSWGAEKLLVDSSSQVPCFQQWSIFVPSSASACFFFLDWFLEETESHNSKVTIKLRVIVDPQVISSAVT